MSDDTSKETPAEETVEETTPVTPEADPVTPETETPVEAEAKSDETPQAEDAPKADEAAKPEEAAKTDDVAKADEAATTDEAAKADEAPKAEDGRFDKLKRAEAILRANAPASSREPAEDLFEKVIHINRCSKVVKGGRRFSFSALVVSGDREGKVGLGFGKALEVAECIKKSSEAAKKAMVPVNITHNTIPHTVIGEHGGARVFLRPASPGTGLIAGGGVRAVVEAAGIKDLLAKSMGSNNPSNVVKATLAALSQLRTKEQIYSLRGKRLAEKEAL